MRVSTLERSFAQLLTSSTPRTVCRSCRLRAGDASQHRQFRTSTALQAGPSLRERLFGPSKKAESEGTEIADDAEQGNVEYFEKGWQKPKEKVLPEGWAATPDKDSGYIVATDGEDLEHVGSDKWVELQFDNKPNYKGWSKVKKASGITAEMARDYVVSAAQDVLGQAVPETAGLGFQVTDMATKFAIAKRLRHRAHIQIPDLIMTRAETLKDFQKAILTKPKPKKLSLDLLANERIAGMGNVRVSGRRQTPIHKDRAVGRWKLIEKELYNRGLPITGHGPKAKRGAGEEEEQI